MITDYKTRTRKIHAKTTTDEAKKQRWCVDPVVERKKKEKKTCMYICVSVSVCVCACVHVFMWCGWNPVVAPATASVM